MNIRMNISEWTSEQLKYINNSFRHAHYICFKRFEFMIWSYILGIGSHSTLETHRECIKFYLCLSIDPNVFSCVKTILWDFIRIQVIHNFCFSIYYSVSMQNSLIQPKLYYSDIHYFEIINFTERYKAQKQSWFTLIGS